MNSIKFSVIIATLNRKNEPLMMLESLKNQSYNNFEVILIDQNDEEIIDQYHIDNYSDFFPLKHIKTSIKGASNARNLGIKNAQGELLTFPDDDCEFHKNFLNQINEYFKENTTDGIVVTSRDKFDGKAISILMASKPQDIHKNNLLKTVVEFAIIVKSNKIKGHFFDPDMGVGAPNSPYWSDEGPDFVLQLLKAGLEFKFCPQFYIFHPNPVKIYNQKTTLRSYRYGKGRGYFLKKHNYGLRSILYYLAIYVVGMCKGMLFLNWHMFNYFKKGFLGRYEGYFLSK